jgi:acetyl-CoA acetyltransferase
MARRKAVRGFKKVQQSIARRQGISMEQAGAILASATRRAKKNPSALKKNPRLKRVKG